jgi:hypothetical protein
MISKRIAIRKRISVDTVNSLAYPCPGKTFFRKKGFVILTPLEIDRSGVCIKIAKKMQISEKNVKIKGITPKSSPDLGKIEQNTCCVQSRIKSP